MIDYIVIVSIVTNIYNPSQQAWSIVTSIKSLRWILICIYTVIIYNMYNNHTVFEMICNITRHICTLRLCFKIYCQYLLKLLYCLNSISFIIYNNYDTKKRYFNIQNSSTKLYIWHHKSQYQFSLLYYVCVEKYIS